MTPSSSRSVSQNKRAAAVCAAALSCAAVTVGLAGDARAAAVGVPLGTAGPFAVLAGAGVTNTGPTTLRGDLGSYPTTTTTGTGTLTITGVNHGGDAVTQGAKRDLQTGYDTAAGEGPPQPITADLAGRTLTAGVYRSASTLGLTGDLTLDAGGNPDAVFIFQAGSTLKTASASRVTLTNGAQACHVFWQVGSSATLGTASAFRGSILALTSISVTTGVTIDGRVLARNGAVTLDTDTITTPTCSTLSSPPSNPPPSNPPPSSPPASSPPSNPPPSSPPASSPPSNPPASSPPAKSPPASAPPAKSPPASAPPAKSPPASAPPAKSPPASAPPAKSPPASAPPAKSPPAKSLPAKSPPTAGGPSGGSHTRPAAGTPGVVVVPGRALSPIAPAAGLPAGTFFAPPAAPNQQTGQAPRTGQAPMTGQVPVTRQVPVTGQVPAAGQVPATGQVPVTSPVGSAAQIRQVPVGAVHAGDGSASTDNKRSPVLPGVALALVVTGATGVVVAGRRRRGQP